MTRGPCGRSGFALAGVVLALALLMALALLAATVARSQILSAGAALDVTSTRLSAESAVEAALEELRGLSPVPPGGFRASLRAGVVGDRPWTLSVYRTGSELHLFIGESTFTSTGSRFRSGRVVWWLDPVARVKGFRGVLEGGRTALPPGAVVSPSDPLGAVGDHPSCRGEPALAAAFPGALLASAPLPGLPEWGDEAGNGAPAGRLGWFDLPTLVELADVVLSERAALAACPACWMGLVVAPDGGTLLGSGAGVLVAAGSLHLAASATWDGLLIAEGDVVLGPGARVTGLVRAGRDWSMADSALVLGSVCAAYRSLIAAVVLHRPMRFPSGSSIGPLPPLGG